MKGPDDQTIRATDTEMPALPAQVAEARSEETAGALPEVQQPVLGQAAAEANRVEAEFRPLVEQWRKDTRHTSSVTTMVSHPAYQRIVAMGRDVLPLLFKELLEHPDHWLVALNAITHEDPAPESATFNEAVQAWLTWARAAGYLPLPSGHVCPKVSA